MRRLAFSSLIALLPAAAGAELPVCDPGRMACSPLVACIEATGEIFRGASFGREAGALHARNATTTCTGNWRRTAVGLGVAEFTCTDGRRGRSLFTWFEPETGTAVGTGRFDTGEVARFWAGNNLARHFAEVDPAEAGRMSCTPADMLLS